MYSIYLWSMQNDDNTQNENLALRYGPLSPIIKDQKHSCTSMKNYDNITIFLIIINNSDNLTLIFFIDTNLSMPNSIMSKIWPSKQRPIKEHKMLLYFYSITCSKEWVSRQCSKEWKHIPKTRLWGLFLECDPKINNEASFLTLKNSWKKLKSFYIQKYR